MAFDVQYLRALGNQSGRGKAPQHFCYRTTDSLATVLGNNYFSDAHTMLDKSDVIHVEFVDSLTALTESQGMAKVEIGVKIDGLIKAFEISDNKRLMYATLADVSTASTTAVTSSVTGYITKITTVLEGAITVGDAAISFDIGGTAITGSAITVANAASAAGDVDTASPTGLRKVVPGSVITATTDGGSTTEQSLYIVYEVSQHDAATNDKVYVTCHLADVSADSSTFVVSPIAGQVTKVWSVLHSAITVANAIVTAKIGGVAMTNGALTITQAGSAAGDVDTATPTAANVVAAGGAIELDSDGGSTTTAAMTFTLEITPN